MRRRHSAGRTTRLALTLLLVGVCLAADAQENTAELTGFLESIRVNLVEVDVLVTGPDDRPVRGLTRNDFQVSEDGKKVKITHFREGNGSRRFGSASAVGGEAPSRDAYVAVLVDNHALHPADRHQVVAALREYLARTFDARVWLALTSYDGYLRVHQTFTRDPRELLAALERMTEPSSLGNLLMTERTATFRNELENLRSIQALVGDLARGAEVSRLVAAFARQIDSHAEAVRQQNLAAFQAIGHLVNALGALPGRKAVVYLGEGLPMRPGEELLAAIQRAGDDLGPAELDVSTADGRDADLDRRSGALDVLSDSVPTRQQARRSQGREIQRPDGLLELTAMANVYQVSLYTLKPVTEYGGIPAEFAGDASRLLTPQTLRVREQNLAATLEVMAADTGGVARLGAGVDDLLERASREATDHYSLAFVPDHSGDGKYHRIEVKVRGKRLEVRHRKGYVDKSIEARVADRTTAALLLALDDNPHGILLATATPEPGPGPEEWIVPIEMEIPLRALTMSEQSGVLVSEAQLFVAARGSDGRTAPVQAMDLRIEVPQSVENPRERSYTARFNLLLRGGAQRLAVGLLDPRAGTISFASSAIQVGPA